VITVKFILADKKFTVTLDWACAKDFLDNGGKAAIEKVLVLFIN
jgi:hypothetical protein